MQSSYLGTFSEDALRHDGICKLKVLPDKQICHFFSDTVRDQGNKVCQ